MRGGVFKSFRLAWIAFYAFSTLVAAMLVAAHHSHAEGIAAHAGSVAFCRGGEGTKDPASSVADCCDACQLSETGFAPPASPVSFSLRREISTRLDFAQRLGRVADATPDNLRSRAPPAAFA